MAFEEYEIIAGEQQEATADSGERTPDAGRRLALTREHVAALVLLGILLVGAYFRFTGLNWDDNHHLHPDERFLTDVALRLETVSDPLTYLRTSESPLNPYNLGNVPLYVYGNFPMTVTRYVAEWVADFCQNFEEGCAHNYVGYDGIHLVGRFLSGFADLFSILFIFLIGRRLYDWRAGLIGALLLAISVLPIQQSHFFTMDNWAATLSTVSMYMAVRAAEDGERKRWWVLFGLSLGLAVASRVNVAPLAAMAGVAAVVWLVRRQRELAPDQSWGYLLTPQGNIDLQRAMLGVLLAAAVSLITFRLAQPYAFADATIVRETVLAETGREPSTLRVAFGSVFGFNPQWVANMAEIQNLQSPEAAFPPGLQWTGRAPILFPLNNMVLYGMGLTAGIAAVLGFLWALWRVAKLHPQWTAHVLLVTWIGGYFLFMGTRWVKSVRYFLPLYPFLLLLAGWALVELWQRARDHGARRLLVALLAVATVVPTLLWANTFVDIYRQPVTRIAASRWMFENIPTGATLLYEVDGQLQEQQLPLKSFQFEPGGLPLDLSFTLPQDGVVQGLRFNYATLLQGEAATLQVTLLSPDGEPMLETGGSVSVSGEREPAPLQLPDVALESERPYLLRIEHAGGGVLEADTSRIVNEEWDDALPVNVDGRAAYGAYYSEVSGGQRPVTWPANQEKRDLMLQWIDEADVIALSSQRSLWNTPRLPLTYPLNIAYYESLFNGELGFELASEFHAELNMGPLYISDTGGEVAWGHYPDIGWPLPGELAAEEAFSVYDHPPVWIFRKTDAYSPQRAQEILNRMDLNNVTVMNPGEASQAPNGLMLATRERVLQRTSGTFAQVFNVDGLLSRQPAVGTAVWWLAVVVLGWLAFPITFVSLPGLPERGYALARILGLLLLSWIGWVIGSVGLLPNNRTTLLLGVALIALLSFVIAVRRRHQLVHFVRHNLRYIGFMEAFALLLFLLGIAIRLGNPDVWDVIWGGEKPMDLSYFTAVVKSSTFPPYDPWYAGGYINYYYYGFVFVGALTELLGIIPSVAYNLILPMLYSFTGLGAFAIAYNLIHRLTHKPSQSPISNLQSANTLISQYTNKSISPYIAGVTATVLCILLGNLGEVGVMLGAWERASDSAIDTGIGLLDTVVRTADGALAVTIGGQDAPIYPGDWFWTATRAINANPGEAAPITEFPFFTFLYGDLHAHMIALPLTLLALAWAVSLVLRTQTSDFSKKSDVLEKSDVLATSILWFTGALAIGVLRPTNTWDWPTYLLLGSLAVIYAAYVGNGRRLSLPFLGQAGLQVAALAALSTLLFWPFVSNFGSGYETLRLWDGSYTHLANYLVIYGLFLFLVGTHLAREFRAWTATWTTERLQQWRPLARLVLVFMGLYVLVLALMALRGYWIAPLVLTLTVVAGLLGLRPGLPAARRVILILISAALGLSLMVEIVVLEGDVGRMNTVFKFYMQVWVMLSIAGGAALALAWPHVQRWGGSRRRSWQAVLGLLAAAALLYPLLATPAKWQSRTTAESPTTLDGMAFMKSASYQDTAYDQSSVTIELAPEHEALRWMQRNVEGSPVVAEAHSGNPYRSIASRVAMYTGLPNIIGWDWHQRQQRAAVPDALVWDRVADVEQLYNSPNAADALDVIGEHDVKYIYAGTLERAYYQPQGLAKFEEMVDAGYLRRAFSNEEITIYEVLQ